MHSVMHCYNAVKYYLTRLNYVLLVSYNCCSVLVHVATQWS